MRETGGKREAQGERGERKRRGRDGGMDVVDGAHVACIVVLAKLVVVAHHIVVSVAS